MREEIAYECQACFTRFTEQSAGKDTYRKRVCPSCGHSESKVVSGQLQAAPTVEQEVKLWEQCGFYIKRDERYPMYESLSAPDGTHIVGSVKILPLHYPATDFNSLFKWAVPVTLEKLESRFDPETNKVRALELLFDQWTDRVQDGYSLEDALFWTIWNILKNDCSVTKEAKKGGA